ncbi:hypothetical protein MRX96_059460 [Rhipicephalus microplus]
MTLRVWWLRGASPATGESSRTKESLAAMQALPLVSGGDTGKVAAATPIRGSGDSTLTSGVTVKATESPKAPRDGELRSLNEQLNENSSVPSSNSVGAPKRPHPQASNGGAEMAVWVVEEAPAKTAQGRWPSLQPHPNLTADKRVDNVENVGQGKKTRAPLLPRRTNHPPKRLPHGGLSFGHGQTFPTERKTVETLPSPP